MIGVNSVLNSKQRKTAETVFEPVQIAARLVISLFMPILMGQILIIMAVFSLLPAVLRAYEKTPGWYHFGLLMIWIVFNLEIGLAILSSNSRTRRNAVIVALVLLTAPYILSLSI